MLKNTSWRGDPGRSLCACVQTPTKYYAIKHRKLSLAPNSPFSVSQNEPTVLLTFFRDHYVAQKDACRWRVAEEAFSARLPSVFSRTKFVFKRDRKFWMEHPVIWVGKCARLFLQSRVNESRLSKTPSSFYSRTRRDFYLRKTLPPSVFSPVIPNRKTIISYWLRVACVDWVTQELHVNCNPASRPCDVVITCLEIFLNF